MKTFSDKMFGIRPAATRPAPLSAKLRKPPRPIVDARNKLILMWSAKAGCTFAIRWFFCHLGILDEALVYNRWIHKYRGEKLYQSEAYKLAEADFCKAPSSYRAIKFVRDPFKRAVSSYVHAVRSSYEDLRLSEFLQRPVHRAARFSFREFVGYLESIDLHTCEIHHRLQVHPLERQLNAGSCFLIDLEHAMESLPRLEVLLGLPPTDPRRHHESRHYTRVSASSTASFSGDTVYDLVGKARPELPDYRAFYDSELEERIVSLYAEDFLRYGFPTTLTSRCERPVA